MRIKLFIASIITATIFSQDKIEPTYMATFGSVTMNNKVYNQISFRPEFTTGKLGIGLDFYLYFDENGKIYNKDWNFSTFESSLKTLVDKIYYIRYGQPFNDVYFRIGALPTVTMGHGILVRNYANNMDYPQVRRIGFDFRYAFSDFRLEFLHSDIKEFSHAGLIGLRTVFPVIQKLDIGMSVVTDLDQINGLIDSDDDSFPDFIDYDPDNENIWHEYEITVQDIETMHDCDYSGGSCPDYVDDTLEPFIDQIENDHTELENELSNNNVSGVSIDLTYSINDKVTVYSEFAQLSGDTNNPYNDNSSFDTTLGYGFIPIGLKVNFGSVLFIMDYRQSSENFIFHYWDKNYEHNRVMIDSNNEPITKESLLYNYGKQKGTSLGFVANISKYLKFSVGYLYMKGDNWDSQLSDYKKGKNNSLYTKFEIDTSRIPKIQIAEIFYQQTNTNKPFDFEPNENTLIGYNIGVELANNLSLILKGRKTYIFDGENYNSIKNTQIETSIYF